MSDDISHTILCVKNVRYLQLSCTGQNLQINLAGEPWLYCDIIKNGVGRKSKFIRAWETKSASQNRYFNQRQAFQYWFKKIGYTKYTWNKNRWEGEFFDQQPEKRYTEHIFYLSLIQIVKETLNISVFLASSLISVIFCLQVYPSIQDIVVVNLSCS